MVYDGLVKFSLFINQVNASKLEWEEWKKCMYIFKDYFIIRTENTCHFLPNRRSFCSCTLFFWCHRYIGLNSPIRLLDRDIVPFRGRGNMLNDSCMISALMTNYPSIHWACLPRMKTPFLYSKKVISVKCIYAAQSRETNGCMRSGDKLLSNVYDRLKNKLGGRES